MCQCQLISSDNRAANIFFNNVKHAAEPADVWYAAGTNLASNKYPIFNLINHLIEPSKE
jgi:hypothetical protein